MISKKYTIAFVSVLCFCGIVRVNACGFYETERDYQALSFKAFLPQMTDMSPFYYKIKVQWNGEPNTDRNESDRRRNCAEWVAQCKHAVSPEDVYQVLYKTDGNLCIDFFTRKMPDKQLAANSFIRFLSAPSQSALLNYLLLAKRIESIGSRDNSCFEDWDYQPNLTYVDPTLAQKQKAEAIRFPLYSFALQEVRRTKSHFLKQRYAYQLCRMSYEYSLSPNASVLYDRYFNHFDPTSLMNVWSALYKASVLSHSESNRWLIKVFQASNEKKFRCVELFDNAASPACLTDAERSTYYTIKALRNPARALDMIQNAYKANKHNPQIAFLVLREVNKVEDWLVSPEIFDNYSITNDKPFRKAVYNPEDNYNPEKEDVFWKSFRADNRQKDMHYLMLLKTEIQQMQRESVGPTRDFYQLALAHLALLQEKAPEARQHLLLVSSRCLPALALQKQIEELWLEIKTGPVHSPAFEKMFVHHMQKINRFKSGETTNEDVMYVLTLALANRYLMQHDIVYGNLMRIRADVYHDYVLYNSPITDLGYYGRINYFFQNAEVKDIDRLITLKKNKHKSEFQQYLCTQTFKGLDEYYDLRGMIAFRTHNLTEALASFEKVKPDFWYTDEHYRNDLNENPFIPKGIVRNEKRRFNYKFNKASFVKALIMLEQKAHSDPQKAADYYNQLGNAYFNTSYRGNATMMYKLGRVAGELFYTRTAYLPQWMNDNMQSITAQHYFRKAYSVARTNEQRAYAVMMLHYIHRLNYDYLNRKQDDEWAHFYGKALYRYRNTRVFATYNCPMLKNYLR